MNKKLEVKLEDLIKCQQQVHCITASDTSSVGVPVWALGFGGESSKELGLNIQKGYDYNMPVCISIYASNITYLDIVQTFGGGDNTLAYAKKFLGLINMPNRLHYITDNDLGVPSVIIALTNLHKSLVKKGIEHSFNLSAGEFCIPIKVIV